MTSYSATNPHIEIKGALSSGKPFFLTLHLPGRSRGRRGLTKHSMSSFPYNSPLPDYTTVGTLLIKIKNM